MPSQKLVRCEVQRPGEPVASTRFIPLEIFGLWEELMTRKHGFEVTSRGASLWIDLEESPEVARTEPAYDRVTELTLFVFSEPDGVFSRVCRYFPTEDCEQLKAVFLAHYSGPDEVTTDLLPQVRERHGIWIRRAAEVLAAS